MEEFSKEEAVVKDPLYNSHLKDYDLLSDPLMDTGKLDTKDDFHLSNEEKNADTPSVIGNTQSGFTSTTRPLLMTSTDEGKLSTEDSLLFDPLSSDVGKSDININSGRDSDKGAAVSCESETAGGELSIDDRAERIGLSTVGDVQKATAKSDISSRSVEETYEFLDEKPLPTVKDPKIGTNLVAERENPKDPDFGASLSSAQTTSEKPKVAAMEGESSTSSTKTADGCCSFSPGVWFNPEKLNPTVADLVYWRDLRKSGVCFGSSLVLLLSLKYLSLISVIAYLTLAVLSVTVSFRIYKNVLQAVQKSNEGHPFKEYLEMDVNLSQEKLKDIFEVSINHVNCFTNKMRSIILVEDLFDTLKMGLFAWCLTYVGAWFNGMTLVIMALLTAFTMPKVYETHKAQIDTYLDIARTKGKEMVDMVSAKIPLGKKKKDE